MNQAEYQYIRKAQNNCALLNNSPIELTIGRYVCNTLHLVERRDSETRDTIDINGENTII